MESALSPDRHAHPPTETTDQALELPAEGVVESSHGPRAVPEAELAAATGSLADLDDPSLVLSEGYIGLERRRAGVAAALARVTFGQRRFLLRLEVLVVGLAVAMVTALLLLPSGSRPDAASAAAAAPPRGASRSATQHRLTPPRPAPTAPASTTTSTNGAGGPSTGTTAPAHTTTTAPPAATPPPAAPAPTATVPPPAAVPPPTTAPPAPPPPPTTPTEMGAAALALVRYPWQSIPGYSIQFLPISDAPSPGFYGNTTFTWGQAGGQSTLYVYPGESIDQLAGITAFEIGHEVDAAAVDPEGGHAQIENILGMHPTGPPPTDGWAPTCDCAEQNYLSGWYAAAFSNAWSPGVGNWASIAPEPTGGVLAAMEPYLNPHIP